MRRVRNLSLASALVGLLASVASGAAAQDGSAITVAQDGSGDHDTIAGAIEAAADGDTIRIAPGTYPESFRIEKDITLAGDGDRSDVVVTLDARPAMPHDGPWGPLDVGVVVEDARATVEGISFRQSYMQAGLVWVEGGAVDFSDVAFEGTEVVLFGGDSTFTDASIDAYFAVRDGASTTVVDSEIVGHASVDGPGRTVIRGSTLRGGSSASAEATGRYEDNHVIGVPLEVDSGADMVIQGNLVEGVTDGPGILVHTPGTAARIIGNTVRDGQIGIVIDTDAPGSIVEDNDIGGARIGIHVDSDSPVSVARNTIEAQTVGIVLQGDGASVVDNAICGSGRALDIRNGSPSIFSNRICAELEP